MSDLSSQESAALRARILTGADGLAARRVAPGRIVAIAGAVVLVAGVAVGVTALAFGQPTPLVAATGTPTETPSPTPTRMVPPSPSPTPTETVPTSTETPEAPPATLENGETIVSDAQWLLAGERGWGSWQMPDGRFIATDPSQPLPAEVTADIQQRMDAIPNNTLDQPGDQTTALIASRDLMYQAASTGKQVIVVRFNAMSTGEPGGGMRWYAQATQDGWWMQVSKNRDQLLADINAWIAATPDPSRWVVFVGPGDPVVP